MYRRLLRTRVRLFDQRRYDRLALEDIHGTPIVVLPQVFNPKLLRTGAYFVGLFNEQLIPPGSTVLDLGTGSGVGAVFAARLARRVVASDINPAAVRCAQINVLLNHCDDRVEVRQGDLFASVCGERFEVILFNPPFYRGQPQGLLDHAWRSPDLIERFAAELPAHLKPGGAALVILSTDGEPAAFLRAFAANHLAIETVARRDLINEILTVYRLTPQPASRTANEGKEEPC